MWIKYWLNLSTLKNETLEFIRILLGRSFAIKQIYWIFCYRKCFYASTSSWEQLRAWLLLLDTRYLYDRWVREVNPYLTISLEFAFDLRVEHRLMWTAIARDTEWTLSAKCNTSVQATWPACWAGLLSVRNEQQRHLAMYTWYNSILNTQVIRSKCIMQCGLLH